METGVEEFSQEEIQNLERQLLGFSLSARPVSELIGPIEHMATHKIFEISPQSTFGETVRVAAVVSEVRIVVTRTSGAEMAFVRVEDGTGSLELVVFPKIFRVTRDVWVDYKPLLISGRVDAREETPALIVEAIETIDALRDRPREVFINIPKEADTSRLKELKSLLILNSGDQFVTLVFEGKQKIRLPIKISWSENLARLISEVLEGNQLDIVQ